MTFPQAGDASDESISLDETRTGPEPGLDLHALHSAWASVDEVVADDPDAAVSQLADLVLRALTLRGYAPGDPVAEAGAEPEVLVTYRAAREAAERAELGEASRSEVETAIEDLREVFDTLVGLRE
jgi:hypothetical protein